MRAVKDRKPRFIKPKNALKEKVGNGGILASLIEKAQGIIEKNDDFDAVAKSYLGRLSTVLSQYESHDLIGSDARTLLLNPVMQLKGNGGMFGYRLVSEIADILLFFIENIDGLNMDSLAVVKAHHSALQAIVSARLKGTGGAEGRALLLELEKACGRYYDKYHIDPE